MTAEALADLLETLVNIPSVTGNEATIAEHVVSRLRMRGGGEIMRSGNAVVWRGPQADRPLIVLAGHLDTVPPNGNATASRRDGKLFGLGATDMKAGVAVMLALLESLDPESLRFDLACVFYDAEEGPAEGNGLKRLMGEMPWLTKAALAILLEPTDNRIELGCNGVMNVEVTVRGKSAHSARPWTGVNAIEVASEWIQRVTRTRVRKVQLHGVEYAETLQVTTLRAGRARNVVPDELVANLNYRFTPDMSIEEAEAKLRALVPLAFEFRIVDRAPSGRACGDDPLVKDFIARFKPELAGKQGWTDVARFTAAGVPAFNFGPGLPELCHQAGEYCPIGNLEPAHRMLAEFLKAGS